MPKRAKKDHSGKVPRAPLPYPDNPEGLQVNFCKRVACENYGKWPSTDYKHPFAGARYRKASGHGSAESLKCLECNISFPMKNNRCVVEETARLEAYLHNIRGCPDKECPNHDKDVSLGKEYYISYGKAPNGAPRYRCRECKRKEEERRKNGKMDVKKKVFAVNPARDPIRIQKKPEKNQQIFLELVNKAPFQRIFERAQTGGGTVYGKIDFFYNQCRAFAAHHERQLLEGTKLCFRRLYLSTDAQVYSVNWKIMKDKESREKIPTGKQNVRLTAVGTADDWSRFVFALNLNFDPDAVKLEIESETTGENDYDKITPLRRHARYWLAKDYSDALKRLQRKPKKPPKPTKSGKPRKKRKKKEPRSFFEKIVMTAYESGKRWNVDDTDVMTNDFKVPDEGMQVHRDYTYLAHFLFLRRLFADNFGKLRFFFDYDSGLRSACLTAFQKEIKARRVDACYVAVLYNQKNYPDAIRKNYWSNEISKIREKFPFWDEEQHEKVKTLLMLRQMKVKTAQQDKKWKDWWVHHPDPDFHEPEKILSFQTYHEDLTPRHLARLYLKASLHGINSFFNFVRRRLSPLERPLDSASAEAGRNYVYGPYNPVIVVKLLEILRVYWNYVFLVDEHREYTAKMKKLVKEGLAKGKTRYIIPKKERKTRAMYLGLCDRPYTVKDVLNFGRPRRKRPFSKMLFP